MSGIRNCNSNGPVEALISVLVNCSNRADKKYDKALEKLRVNYMQIYTKKQYLDFDHKTLCKLLDSDDVNVENEQVVFDSVRQWSIYNDIRTDTHIESLMKVVRLSLLPTKYLFDEVEPFVYPFEDSRHAFINELRHRNIGEKKAMVRKHQKISIDITKNRKTTPTASGKLLVIQDQKSSTAKSLQVFDSKTNQWTRLKDLDISSQSINYSVACIGDILWIIGGASAKNKNLSKSVIAIDVVTGRLSRVASLNNRRQQSATVVAKQGILTFVYTIGGITDENTLKSVERWDSISRTWTMVTPMMTARTGHGAVLLQNKIYVVGGKTETGAYDKSIEAYDFENDRWTSKAPMNNPNAYFGIATFKNHIFVVGGNRDSATPVNIVERYDPVQNIWTTIANISSKGAVGISSMGDRLICAGGNSSDIVQEYDENSKQWQTLNPLSNKCSSFLVELQPGIEIYSGDWIGLEKLIFLGGFNANEGRIVEIFDTVKDKWSQLKQLPRSRTEFNVNLISDKLLIIGGNRNQKSVDAIDLSSGTIQSLPPLREGRAFTSSVVVTYEDKQTLYVIGGFDYTKFLSSVEKWDPLTNKWSDGVPMPTARSAVECIFFNGTIYAVGGDIGPDLNIVEAFSIANNKWIKKAPMNHARRYFGIAIFENHIYVTGGVGTSTVERYNPLENTWTTLASIQSSWHVGLCTLGDRLICAGGNKNNVQEYDSKKNRWVSLPAKITAPQNGYLLQLPENAILENW